MERINIGRVIVGGIVAGIIINLAEGIVNGAILGQQWKEWAQSLGPASNPPSNGAAMGLWTLLGFALGFVGLWLYAAIRPRYGASPKTALLAGFVLWLIYWPLVDIQHIALGAVPHKLLAIGTCGGLVGVLIAMLAGAALYKEQKESAINAPMGVRSRTA